LAALVILAARVGFAGAVDLTTIKRTIAKEPHYQSGAPKYGLLVFGPKAKTHVWLVRDGDVLYVDLNANGNLTEKYKRLTIQQKEKSFGIVLTPPLAGKNAIPRNTRLKVKFFADGVEILAFKDRVQHVATDANGNLQFSDKPGSAPVIHFGGPLTLSPNDKYTFPRGRQSMRFSVLVGTQGLGPGTMAALFHSDIYAKLAKDIVPMAEITFPPRVAGRRGIKTKVPLDGRC
jgi:hypothetical protein